MSAQTRQLAYHGARVYMASRSEPKAHDAIQQLQQAYAKDSQGASLDLHFLPLDLMHIAAAKTCAHHFLAKEAHLDILVCNAGVMAVEYMLTDDGVEQSFQVNHLTHFALFQALVPAMVQAARKSQHPSRLVNLSSLAHTFSSYNPLLTMDFTSKHAVNRHMGYGQVGKYMRYSQAKLAALLFARHVNRRFAPDEIRASAVHPGLVATNLYQKTPLAPFAHKVFISASEGALSALYAATSPQIEEENSWCVIGGAASWQTELRCACT